MTTYGSDFSGVEDIDAFWSFETDEVKCLQQAIARRLICPPGALFYAPTYGFDIRAFINDVVDVDTAGRNIDAEVRKDERVANSATVVTALGNGVVSIAVTVTPANPKLSPFSFTLSVTSVTVQLLGSAT
jgi:hypothetical protein